MPVPLEGVLILILVKSFSMIGWTRSQKALELRTARLVLLQSRQYCAVTFRQHDGYSLHQEGRGTWSPTLCKKSLWLWCQVIRRQLTILPPQWLALEENTEANFLSILSLQRWDFKLVSTEFWKSFQRLDVWSPLDAFAFRGSHQVARYMTWYQDSRVVSLCSGLSMGSINLIDLGITSQEDLINKSQNLKKEEQEETPVNSSG